MSDKSSSLEEILAARLKKAASANCTACRTVRLSRILEGLAVLKTPEATPRSRVTRLLETSAAWPDKTRVSLSQLKLHLEVMFSDAERKTSRLYTAVTKQLKTEGAETGSAEPFFYQLEEMARADEVPALQMTRYLSLLTAFCRMAADRPAELHDQVKGRGDSDEPAYKPWQGGFSLHFPPAFLLRIAGECIDNLRKGNVFSGVAASEKEFYERVFEEGNWKSCEN